MNQLPQFVQGQTLEDVLQLQGTFLALWDDILPPIPEDQWRGNLALVAAWLAEAWVALRSP